MPKIDFSVDKRDISFVLFEQLGFDKFKVMKKYQDLDQETVEMLLEQTIKFATEVLAPINREGDEKGAVFSEGQVRMPESFKKAYAKFVENGWSGFTHTTDLGGQGFPELLGSVFSEIVTAANTSFALLPMLCNGTSHLIEAFGTSAMKKLYCPKLYSGVWGGTMCLTEPGAGSDVGAAVTTATPQGDHYLIQGTKIFITFGEHDAAENIIHAVLARVPGGPPGSRGISLFLVPKFLVDEKGKIGEFNDVRCARIEHKMGIHASPTCVMSFGEEGKCKGWLLGEVHQGLKCMFQMMNEARLGVGVQGLAGAAVAYQSALGYAMQRKQGSHIKRFKDPAAPRVEIIAHPDIRRMLLTMKAYVEGIRSLIYHTGYFADLSHHHPDKEQRDFFFNLLEITTPICKSYGSDMGFKVCDLAMQTYGGYGYTRDYPVEQYLRDTKIAAIYEGTNGIQAIDLFSRKVAGGGGIRFMQMMQWIDSRLADLHAPSLRGLIQSLDSAKTQIAETTMLLLQSAQSGDLEHGLLHANDYLEMFGNFLCAFFLLDAASIADSKLQALYQTHKATTPDAKTALHKANPDAAFYHAKICTAQFFIHTILPKNDAIAASIQTNDRSAMDILFPDEQELSFS